MGSQPARSRTEASPPVGSLRTRGRRVYKSTVCLVRRPSPWGDQQSRIPLRSGGRHTPPRRRQHPWVPCEAQAPGQRGADRRPEDAARADPARERRAHLRPPCTRARFLQGPGAHLTARWKDRDAHPVPVPKPLEGGESGNWSSESSGSKLRNESVGTPGNGREREGTPPLRR